MSTKAIQMPSSVQYRDGSVLGAVWIGLNCSEMSGAKGSSQFGAVWLCSRAEPAQLSLNIPPSGFFLDHVSLSLMVLCGIATLTARVLVFLLPLLLPLRTRPMPMTRLTTGTPPSLALPPSLSLSILQSLSLPISLSPSDSPLPSSSPWFHYMSSQHSMDKYHIVPLACWFYPQYRFSEWCFQVLKRYWCMVFILKYFIFGSYDAAETTKP